MDLHAPAIAAVAAPFGRDVDAGLRLIERLVVSARAQGADLVVFPECALGGYVREPMAGESAPELPPALDREGPEIAELIRIAGDTVLCVGYSEADIARIWGGNLLRVMAEVEKVARNGSTSTKR